MHSGGLTHPEQKMAAVKTELQCDRGQNGQQTNDLITFIFRFSNHQHKSKFVMKHHLFMMDGFSAGSMLSTTAKCSIGEG